MRPLLMMLGCLTLAACGGGARTAETLRYDFGEPSGGAALRIPVTALDVQAASWLAGPEMHFRLTYAEPLQRRSYGESRWAAPPAELLDSFVKRRLLFGPAETGSKGCRLQLLLGEFEQRFDDAQSSNMVLEVRAQLSAMRSPDILARRAFLVRKPAAADARGGAGAAREAALALGDELAGWLGELARDKPAIADRCRN